MPYLKDHQQSNSGRTHFKKGSIPWNKGKNYITLRVKKVVDKKCTKCNSLFQIECWRLKDKNRGKFCSQQCSKLFRSGRNSHFFGKSLIGKDNPAWKNGKPDCIDCNKKLSIYTAKRCQSCNLRFHSGENHHFYGKPRLEFRGDKHPCWKGGKGRERHRAMGQIEYKIWREAVFARDNWTCVNCNKTKCYLEADHIKPWALYPEARYAIGNGRTLCKDCHLQTDSYPKQFIRRVDN